MNLLTLILLTLLSTVGLANAFYFTLVYYGFLRPDNRFVPSIFCNSEEKKCINVLGTPYARVFWVPNSLLGILYYLSVLGLVVGEFMSDTPLAILNLYVGVAVFTVGFGLYLTYALFFRLKIPCPLCLAGHGINLVIAAIMVGVRIIS